MTADDKTINELIRDLEDGVDADEWLDTIYEAMLEFRELRAKAKLMQDALERIVQECGKVCQNFEVCEHQSCGSSYLSWAIADAVVNPVKPDPVADPNSAAFGDT